MNLDLILFGLVLLAAVFGAFSGAAKQIAHLVALVAAYAASRPVGEWLTPTFSRALNAPSRVGQVAATLVVFIVILVLVRLVLTLALRRLMAGRDPKSRGVDRALGFLLGGTKVGLLIYVVVCALTFVEQNVVVAGRKLGLSPSDSAVFAMARRYNVFQIAQFQALKDLIAVAQASKGPERPEKDALPPALAAIQKDPRFQKLLSDEKTKKAIERGDYQTLWQSREILKLLEDQQFSDELGKAAQFTGR